MKLLLLLFALVLVKISSAQVKENSAFNWKKFQQQKQLKALKDALRSKQPMVVAVPQNRIPNAFITRLPAAKKLGNNKKGQDIYQLPLDNMPLLKPDSSLVALMPNAGGEF